MNVNKRKQLEFDQLYGDFYKDVYRFVYSLVGDPEEASDMTQDTFLKLFRYLEESDTELVNPKAWIFRVAANNCYNRVKRKNRFQRILTQHFCGPEPVGSVDMEVMKAQEVELLRKALDKLPPRDRVILTLYRSGFSPSELADMIQVKQSSIGKTLARSVEKLAKLVKAGGLS